MGGSTSCSARLIAADVAHLVSFFRPARLIAAEFLHVYVHLNASRSISFIPYCLPTKLLTK
jgi:hypothetical protein